MLLLSPPEPEEQGPSLSRLNLYHEDMMQYLRTIKSTFSPRGRLTDKELWTWIPNKPPSLVNLVVEYEQAMSAMFNWEDDDVPGWKELEIWIDSANRLHGLRMEYCGRVAAISGQDLDERMTLSKLRNGFAESPAHAMVARTYGPNWEKGLDGILRSYGASSMSLSQLMPLDKCRHLAQHRADEILHKWEMLGRRHRDGDLQALADRWALLGRQARSCWLKSLPNVWDDPHQDIEAWAESSAPAPASNPKLFLSSLLNAEDLAVDNHLLEFLQSRATVHPQLLREIDARSIPFGLYLEALPALRCEGRMIFSNATVQDNSYSFDVTASNDGNWSALDPCNGLLSLQAQLAAYEFCLSCLSRPLPELDAAQEDLSACVEQRTLLDRCARLDCISPDVIDLKYIRDLLQTSLDEAHDDLWQLRQDDEFWLQRMRETKPPDCASKLVGGVFRRVDVFTALVDVVDEAMAVHGSSAGVPSRLDDDRSPDAIIYLEAALLSAQNDILQSLSATRRPKVPAQSALGRLLELFMTDSPLLRVMDVSRALRVVDRHIRLWTEQSGKAPLPSSLIRAINDLAVLTFGLGQVCNHYLFKTTIGPDHFKRFDDLDRLWQARPRPWSNLFDATCNLLNVDTRRKLDLLWTRDTVSLEERHYQFWAAIDSAIDPAAVGHPEYDSILTTLQSTRPTKPQPLQPEPSLPNPTWLPPTDPTPTALQKGKKRAPSIPTQPLPPPTIPSIPPLDTRPVIPVPMSSKRTWTFWHDLLHNPSPASSSRKLFHWNDLVSAMASLGYAHEATTGSVYRFEYRYKSTERGGRMGINFHRPHDGVLSGRQARKQWRGRILRRVRLELVEE